MASLARSRSKRLLRSGLFAFVIGLICGASSCSHIQLDRSLSAAEGNSNTLFLSGCGQEPLQGRVYCEIREGANPTQTFSFFFPASSCKRQTCVSYQFLRLDGSYGPGGSVPKGVNRLTFPMSYFTESTLPVGVAQDGEYQLLMTIYYMDGSGVEHKANMKGLIRLVVTNPNYVSMGCDDPNVAWTVKPYPTGKCRLQWSTALRAAKCGRCLDQNI